VDAGDKSVNEAKHFIKKELETVQSKLIEFKSVIDNEDYEVVK
jgi:hypothetical protein